MAGAAWTTEETRVLLALWGDDSVQRSLEGTHRNRAIFERIQREMTAKGYNRTWQQCRVRVKNLISTYRKILTNNRSGQGRADFPFYDNLDRILRTRPASRPTNLLSSSSDSPSPSTTVPANSAPVNPDDSLEPDHEPLAGDELDPPSSAVDPPSPQLDPPSPQLDPPTTLNPKSTTGSHESQHTSTQSSVDDSTADIPGPSPQSTASTGSNSASTSTTGSTIKRKRTDADRRMCEVLEHLERQSQESHRRYMEFEERMRASEREYEEKRRKEDYEYLMSMQQMFTQQLQQMLFVMSGYPVPPGPSYPHPVPPGQSYPHSAPGFPPALTPVSVPSGQQPTTTTPSQLHHTPQNSTSP